MTNENKLYCVSYFRESWAYKNYRASFGGRDYEHHGNNYQDESKGEMVLPNEDVERIAKEIIDKHNNKIFHRAIDYINLLVNGIVIIVAAGNPKENETIRFIGEKLSRLEKVICSFRLPFPKGKIK